MNSMVETKKENILSKVIVGSLSLVFFGCAILYVLYPFPLFMIINGALLLSFTFIFQGRYRIYAYAFYLPMAKFMIIQNADLGSFFTWNIIIYSFVVFIEMLLKRETLSSHNKAIIIFLTIFALYMLVVNLINIGTTSFYQYFSAMAYLFLLIALVLDKKGEKNKKTLIISFALGVLLSNIIPAVFIYFFKSQAIPFLSTYIPNYVSSYQANNAAAFRFPGLLGDPNHNACCILLVSTLLVMIMPRNNKTIGIVILLFLQLFALLGASKTYFFGLAIIVIMLLILRFYKTKYFLIVLMIFIGVALFAFVILLNTSLGTVFKRIIIIDNRVGFLDAITTHRTTIYSSYLISMLSDPIRFLIGHGINASNYPINMDAHNTLIEMIWHFGMIGSIFYCAFFYNFFKFNFTKIPRVYLLPIIVILAFSLALHLAYKEYIYMGIFIYYTFLSQHKVEMTDGIQERNNTKIDNCKDKRTEIARRKNKYEIHI